MKQLIGLGFFIIIWTFVSLDLPAYAQEPNYLHSEGSRIVDSHGNQVIMTGINWFGLETESFAPHGLWARSLESMLDQIQDLGFNTLRLPYSNELFDPSSAPNGINYDLNPELEGQTGLEIMDKIIEGAGERGIRVILDRHRPDSNAQSELWYTSEYNEERWINDWVMLAERYAGNATVVGMDLHNEPHGQATWGTGDPATDWRLAAERAGNVILAVNPHLLIIVEGVERYQDDWYWWGGNLMGAGEYPVRLDQPDQLVYSTHVYGPGVYPQPWFSEPDFPDNLLEIWEQHWAYLSRENTAPIIVGEFGGRSVGQDLEGIWQRSLVSYLRENNLSYFYWTLNPNSGDTGGLLLDDWQTVDSDKQALLSDHQFPSLGAEVPTIEPLAQIPTVGPINPDTLRVKYRTANAAQNSQDSKPEFIITNSGSTPVPLASIELFYWLADESNQPFGFHCDWAAVGCSNVSGEFNTTDDGGQFLRLFFSPAAGVLQQEEDSGEIKIRFNRIDWTPFQQNDDFSFAPQTEYTEWSRVSLYVNGERIWGEEPGTDNSAASGNPVIPATPLPDLPTTIPSPQAASPTVEQPQVAAVPTELAEEESAEEIVADNLAEGSNISPTSVGQIGASNDSDSTQPVLISLLIVAAVLLLGIGILVGLRLSRGRS
jgi:endoglucanase